MRRMVPAGLRGNFQDMPVWRHSVVELLHLTLVSYDGPVIVPMTLVDPDYFSEIIGCLRDYGFAVHHFALLAEPSTVRRPLGRRSLATELKRGNWAIGHLDACPPRPREPQSPPYLHHHHQRRH